MSDTSSDDDRKHVDPSEDVDVGDDPFSKPAPPKPKPATPEEKEIEVTPEPETEKPKEPPMPKEEPGSREGTVRVLDPIVDAVAAFSKFQFKVTDPKMTMPEKATDLGYWIYHVVTKCELPGWGKNLRVPRRYSDFVWLRDAVCYDNPGCIIPPLPEKNVKGQIEKIVLSDADLLSYRQRAMTKFLSTLAVHKYGKESEHLQAFCEKETSDWEAYKTSHKRTVEERTASSSGGAMSSMVQKGKEGWFKMWKKKGVEQAASAEETAKNTKLEDRKTYAKNMEEALSLAQDRLKRHIDNRNNISKSLSELSSFLNSTGELESTADQNLGSDLKNSGNYTNNLSKLAQAQAAKENMQVLEVLKYYVGCYVAIKEEIRRIQRMQVTMNVCKDDVDSATTALTKAGGSKMAKAEQAKATADRKYKEAKERYQKACVLFDEEYADFHANKKRDLKKVQQTFVQLQIQFGRQTEKLEHAPIQPAVFGQ